MPHFMWRINPPELTWMYYIQIYALTKYNLYSIIYVENMKGVFIMANLTTLLSNDTNYIYIMEACNPNIVSCYSRTNAGDILVACVCGAWLYVKKMDKLALASFMEYFNLMPETAIWLYENCKAMNIKTFELRDI